MCLKGYFGMIEDGEIKACIENEEICDFYNLQGKCIACPANYYLKDDECVEVSEDRKINGCLFYSKHLSCEKCSENYIMEFGYCKKISK